MMSSAPELDNSPIGVLLLSCSLGKGTCHLTVGETPSTVRLGKGSFIPFFPSSPLCPLRVFVPSGTQGGAGGTGGWGHVAGPAGSAHLTQSRPSLAES